MGLAIHEFSEGMYDKVGQANEKYQIERLQCVT